MIIHLAAVTSVLASVEDPVSTYQINVAATARLLELARENEVGTFLLASTNAVVGNGQRAGETITERSRCARSARTARPRRPRRCCSAATPAATA